MFFSFIFNTMPIIDILRAYINIEAARVLFFTLLSFLLFSAIFPPLVFRLLPS